MAGPRIAVFAGSLRAASYNKQLARVAAEMVRAQGGEPEYLELQDHPLPLFDQDLEEAEGEPANATQLKRILASADALIIASPEYNASISGVLKNTLDWVSRPVKGEPRLVAYNGKLVALLAASPGSLGGLRGLVHLRAILGGLGMLVLPEQLALPAAHEAFDEKGDLRDPKTAQRLEGIVAKILDMASKLK